MGSVVSIMVVVGAVYMYRANHTTPDVVDQTAEAPGNNDADSGFGECLHPQAGGWTNTARTHLSSGSLQVLPAARGVDASHAIISQVGGDQHISITTGIDLERRNVGDWLSPLNFTPIQSEIFQTRQDGTGEWLLECDEFKLWRDGPSEMLWCPGLPGAGKTVLTSIIVNHLQTFFMDQNVAIACIYCDYRQQNDQTVCNLIASLLKQLIQDHTAAFNNVKSIYKAHGDKGTRLTIDELQKVLQSEIEKYSTMYIVVDALDECSEPDGTRAGLLSMLRSLGGSVKLLVTSRYLEEIAQEFHGTRRLDIHASAQDVRRYIEGRISREGRLTRHVNRSQTLQAEVVKKITEQVEGMFLLARLHMDSLATTISPQAVREALQNLPKGVDETYDETMKRIEGQPEEDGKLAKRVFCWITCACRQLSIEELQHALAVAPNMTWMEPDALVDEAILTSVCAGLVVVDKQSRVVRLVHYTTQKYFEQKQEVRLPDAQADITATCIRYLSFDVFQRGYFGSYEEMEYFRRSNALVDYAAQYWGHHARRQVDGIVHHMVATFLQNCSHFPCVSQLSMVSGRFLILVPKDLSGEHISAFFGLEQAMKYLLLDCANADLKDSTDRTPLSWAAEEGHETVAKLLVVRDDVDVNSKDADQQSPLLWAVIGGHEAVVKLLLLRDDVDVDSKDANGQTPLSLAVRRGHKEAVKLLLARDDLDVNSEDTNARTPLSFAAVKGHEAVAKLLLARDDVDVNSKDANGQTALSFAAREGHEAVVMLLLARDDVDVNSRDLNTRTPLSLAAGEGCEAVAKLLLARDDVDVNSMDGDERTPLSFAAREGHEAVVKLLLARDDVDVNSKDVNSRPPLWWAACGGHEVVAKLLLARDDVDVDSKDANARTPLSLAAGEGHEGVVKLLLARGDVDVNSQDVNSRTPLSFATVKGHEAVVKLLLAQDDVDPNLQDVNAETPLSLAVWRGHEEVVKLLLARDDVDVNSEDVGGQTAAAGANRRRRELAGYECTNAAVFCSREGREAMVKLLLVRDDIDLNLQDEAVVKLLLARGGIDTAR